MRLFLLLLFLCCRSTGCGFLFRTFIDRSSGIVRHCCCHDPALVWQSMFVDVDIQWLLFIGMVADV